MVFAEQVDSVATLLAVGLGVAAVHVVLWLTMRYSVGVLRLIKQSGVTLITRIAGLLLPAIASPADR